MAASVELDAGRSETCAGLRLQSKQVEILAALVANVTGADDVDVDGDRAVPPREAVPGCAVEHRAPFRLDVQTEPALRGGTPGQLSVFHDLVTDDPRFAHRLAAAPCRIPEVMAPVVEAMQRHTSMATLLREAPSLLPLGYATAATVERATVDIARVAAIKGCLRLFEADG